MHVYIIMPNILAEVFFAFMKKFQRTNRYKLCHKPHLWTKRRLTWCKEKFIKNINVLNSTWRPLFSQAADMHTSYSILEH